MDNIGTGLVVLGLGDPHGGEGVEGGEDGTTDPDHVLTLGEGVDLDLGAWGSEVGDLLLETLTNVGEHGGTTGEDDVGEEILTDIDIGLLDGVVGGGVDATEFLAHDAGLEEDFGDTESLVSDGDDGAIGHLVALLDGGAFGALLELLVVVHGDVAELLLHITDDLALGGGGEVVASLGEDALEVLGQVTAGEVETEDGVGEGVALVDGDGVGDTITGIEDATGGTGGGVEGEDGLDLDVHGGDAEGLEHDLGHSLSVGLGVHGGLGQEDGMLVGGDTELVVEGVVPDLLHIVPVGDDTVLDGVLDGQDTSHALGFIADEVVLVLHTDHVDGVLGAADDGGEDGAGGIIAGETGLAHTGTIINNNS